MDQYGYVDFIETLVYGSTSEIFLRLPGDGGTFYSDIRGGQPDICR